ncbi:MAG: hypothetical protein KAS62_05210, partial [Candidatus Delongbacteria bacterium]|nr:hypothetical protein [Candidatus Delongbacteria bacterium]
IGQLSAPTNITSYVNGNDITFDWDDVPGATGYQIYSTADPYGMSFDYEATVYVSQYTVEIIDQKKFYYIIAIME